MNSSPPRRAATSELRIERVIARGDRAEDLAARFVSQHLVHLREIVHVDRSHRVRPSEALGLAMLLLQHFLERAQVQQAGQRVGRSEIADALRGAVHLLDQRREINADRGAGRERAQQLHAEIRAADVDAAASAARARKPAPAMTAASSSTSHQRPNASAAPASGIR